MNTYILRGMDTTDIKPPETPTLRDQFAMAALARIPDMPPDDRAEEAYDVADAMLKAREE